MRFKMALPGFKKTMNKVTKIKLCREPGCEREYEAYSPIQKYCPAHADPTKRKRIKPKYIDVTNQRVPTKNGLSGDTIIMEFQCALEGCSNRFRVKQWQGQKVLPKYCDDHRAEYRREYFLKMKRKEPVTA